MVAVPSRPIYEDPNERRLLLHGVSWDAYVALDDSLGEHPGVHLTYLEGDLEIMTVGPTHEVIKSRIRRLLEVWSLEMDIDLRACGGPTHRKKKKQRGLEPDESYTLGPPPRTRSPQQPARPDLAIEVVVTSPLLDKLRVYAGLGVPELWVWRQDVIHVYVLHGTSYREVDRSALLPSVDLRLLAELAREENQLAAIKQLRAALRG